MHINACKLKKLALYLLSLLVGNPPEIPGAIYPRAFLTWSDKNILHSMNLSLIRQNRKSMGSNADFFQKSNKMQ
jgi:hypothetical protein